MPNRQGFVLIDVLMEGVAVTGVLAITAMGAIQVGRAVSGVSEARTAARYEVVRNDLEDLLARQALHYADELTYSSSPYELGLEPSPDVLVEIVASEWGWAAAATHSRLEPGAVCVIYAGQVHPPDAPVAPPTPGAVACTD